MSWTKRQLINKAFAQIGFSSYQFDLEPEQLQDALSTMDSMIATWNANGIRIGYPISSSPQLADIDTDTAITDSANEAIYLNLAIRLAPSLGKMIAPELKQTARMAYSNLLSKSSMPHEMQISGLPSGAGTKYWQGNQNVFLPKNEDALDAGVDSVLDLN